MRGHSTSAGDGRFRHLSERLEPSTVLPPVVPQEDRKQTEEEIQ